MKVLGLEKVQMKYIFLALTLACALWIGLFIRACVLADFEYGNQIESYWNLSVKASTLQQKSTYLDKYVSALQSATLADYDALWLKTPNNNVQQNFVALKSLQTRMHEIFGMDPNSFPYQQAIQQITQQEQDDAKDMLGVFEGAWYLKHHFFLWRWVALLYVFVVVVLGIIFGIASFVGFEGY
jgi:hypothetical protein